MGGDAVFPRGLTDGELRILRWVLPEGRPGYERYRELLQRWAVVGARPWNDRSYILASTDSHFDLEAPQEQIVALGVMGAGSTTMVVTVRQLRGEQVEFELAGPEPASSIAEFERLPRWRLSAWASSFSCPECGRKPREVAMQTESGRRLVLALCAEDHRLWVFDQHSGMNLPLPLTRFYNELMLQLRIQDPRVVLHPERFFVDLAMYSDPSLIKAFEAYNRIRGRIDLDRPIVLPAEARPSRIRQAIDRILRRSRR
jgi:hypothetical protein